jgi:hypothetical protein
LVGFFLLSDIVEVKSIFDLCDLRIWKLGPFLRIVLYFNKNAVFLPLRIHQCPGFLPQRFVGVFELMDLLRTADDIFQLPGGLTVAQIFPLDHVEVVDFHVQVKSSHVWQVDVVVCVLHEFFTIVFILEPVVAELAWIKLFQLLFGGDIFSFFVREEDVFLVKLLHIQIISLLLHLIHLCLLLQLARVTLLVQFGRFNFFGVGFLILVLLFWRFFGRCVVIGNNIFHLLFRNCLIWRLNAHLSLSLFVNFVFLCVLSS